MPVPRLRIVYRSHGSDNGKQRPSYYSKLLALVSLLRATEELDSKPALVFVNDGPIPPRRSALMQARGEIVPISGGSNRRSYRAMLAREAARAGTDTGDEITWFAEDDYLYRPDSLRRLLSAAAELPHTDYFAMYGTTCLDTSAGRRRTTARPLPGAADDPHARTIDDVAWFRAMSTTSTFGLRSHLLREDARLLRTCPLTGGAWDSTTCLVAQGYQPFEPGEVRADLLPMGTIPLTGWPRSIARGLSRTAISLRAHRRPSRRRQLFCSDPQLVSHMDLTNEEPYAPAAAAEWERVATDTHVWAAGRGIDLARPGADRTAHPIPNRWTTNRWVTSR